jgi:hypothetical protein
VSIFPKDNLCVRLHRPHRLRRIVRNGAPFSRGGRSDLPVGLPPPRPVQPPSQKYSAFPKTQITPITSAVSTHQKGRIAIVTDAGRDAVDAAASGVQLGSQGGLLSVSDHPARRTNGACAYGEIVWSWRLKVGVKSRGGEAGPTGRRASHHPRGDGDKQILITGESSL